MSRIVAMIAVAGLALFAGCTGLSTDEQNEKNLREHYLILHPPVYEWNNEKRELTGHFILTNRFMDLGNPDHVIELDSLNVAVDFEGGGGQHLYGGVGRYTSFQDVVIGPGASMVFNFTHPEPNPYAGESVAGTVNGNHVSIGYTYFYIDESNANLNDNPTGHTGASIYNQNRCLQVVNGELHQRRDTSGCNPWEGDRSITKSQFRMTLEGLPLPPADVWPEWTDDIPSSESGRCGEASRDSESRSRWGLPSRLPVKSRPRP